MDFQKKENGLISVEKGRPPLNSPLKCFERAIRSISDVISYYYHLPLTAIARYLAVFHNCTKFKMVCMAFCIVFNEQYSNFP